MQKHLILFSIIVITVASSFLLTSSAQAAAPTITQVRYKAGGDGNKIAVFFDQAVQNTTSTPQFGFNFSTSSFVLGGTYAAPNATITAVVRTVNENFMTQKFFVVLQISTSVNPTGAGQWTIAPATTSVFNSNGEAMATTSVDLAGASGVADGVAPSVRDILVEDRSFMFVNFSEEVDATTSAANSSYGNFILGSASGTIQSLMAVPEATRVFVRVTASTSLTLASGAGNTLDVGGVLDLVGNAMATTTITLRPALQISEVMPGTSANTEDEFLEIYNSGNIDFTAATSTLFLHIRNVATDTTKTLIFTKNRIPAQGFFLICSSGSYSGTVPCDATYDSSTFDITTSSAVYISATTSTSTALRFDLIGMTVAQLFEGTTTATLAAGQSFERKATGRSSTSTMAVGGSDESKGNFWDTDINGATTTNGISYGGDFLVRTTPQPQNSASPKEFPFGGGQTDTAVPQVGGTFPSGNTGEVVPTNLQFIGFGFTKPVDGATVGTSTVKLFPSATPAVNLCSVIDFVSFPKPEDRRPPGKCILTVSLSATTTYTFKIFGTTSTSTAVTGVVKDFTGNGVNQPSNMKGDGAGNYVITFSPSAGGGNFTFQAPPTFVFGALPSSGSVNIPTNVAKVFVKFSGDVATSSTNLGSTRFRLAKVSDGSAVTIASSSAVSSGGRFISDVVALSLGATLSANTQYRITVTGATDSSGRTINDFNSFFTTGASADTVGPQVVGKIPNITSGVPVNAIDIHVQTDKKLDPTTIGATTVSVLKGTNTVPGTVSFDPLSGEIKFFAQNVFVPSTSYTVSLNATGSTICIKSLAGLCLQANSGLLYQFSFTTGAADTQAPTVVFSSADQRNLSVTFSEPLNPNHTSDLNNYTLTVGGQAQQISSLAGQRADYFADTRSVAISGLNLPVSSAYTVSASTSITDLSGNAIDGANNSAQGTIQDQSKTFGFVGPGGPPPSGRQPDSFSSSQFSFVPKVKARPLSPLVGATTFFSVDVPISKQIKVAGSSGKLTITLPSGFDASGASLQSFGQTADANGPGPGTLTPSLTTTTKEIIVITHNVATRCDSGNTAPCVSTSDAHDFLHYDITGIVNSAIPKGSDTGGYTVDVKTYDGTNVQESLTSDPFFLIAGGNDTLNVTINATSSSAGTAKVRIFSPLTGPREITSPTFAAGSSTVSFAGLVDATDYYVFTDRIVTLGSNTYLGQGVPAPIRVNSTTVNTTLTLQPTAGLTTATVRITAAPASKNVDVFVGGPNGFFKIATTTTGSTQNTVFSLPDGSYFAGVGPQIKEGFFSGPPPAADFISPAPAQLNVSNGVVSETSGTANDGIIEVSLTNAGQTITGTVVDDSGKSIVGAQVFAYSPLGGFRSNGQTDGLGKFSIAVSPNTYQLGAAASGLPPSSELAVTVASDGTFKVNGQTVTSVTLKLNKPGRSISGKTSDQSNNPVSGSGIFAFCAPDVSGNACLGPGDHTGTPVGSDGTYTLYVKAGTWRVGAFLPGYGNQPLQTATVTTADITDVNFSPSTSVTLRTATGTVCIDTNSNAACDSGEGRKGVSIRISNSSNANQAVTDQSGLYQVSVPSGTGYKIEAYDSGFGRLTPLTNVDLSSGNVSAQNFVIASSTTVTVNVKNSAGTFVTAPDLFIDFSDATTSISNSLRIKNATSGTITLPNGVYRMRGSLLGRPLTITDFVSDNATTTVDTSTAAVVVSTSSLKAVKVILPPLVTVTGTVAKADSTVVGSAIVEAIETLSGFLTTVQANASGTYSMTLPINTSTAYKFSARAPGLSENYVSLSLTSTTSVTQNLTVTQGTLAISGTIKINGTAASKAFVRAKRGGGGYSGGQTGSDGTYSLTVGAGTWSIFAVADGYAETQGSTVTVTTASVTGADINLTSQVALAAPTICSITPANGGECVDDTNGIRVIVPPSALGTDTNPGSLTIKQTNALQQTSGVKTLTATGFDFSFVDSNQVTISTFNSPLTLQFSYTPAALSAGGITTPAAALKTFISLRSETLGWDTLPTTVDFLDASGNPVASPTANLSNVTTVRFRAPTSHFSGGGPSGPSDSVAPSAPTAVTAVLSGAAIAVTWTAPTTSADATTLTDLSDYRVWRSTTNGNDFSVVTTVAGSSTSYTDSSVTAATSYFYQVTARDTSGNESAQSSSSVGITASGSSGGGSSSSGGGGGGGGGVIQATPTIVNQPTTPAATTNLVEQYQQGKIDLATLLAQVKTAPAAGASVKPVFARTLKIGARGDDVKVIQDILEHEGYLKLPKGVAKGYFGVTTGNALKRYQKKLGLRQTGQLDAATRKKITDMIPVAIPMTETTIKPVVQGTAKGKITHSLDLGARGADVTVLQTFLKAQGFLQAEVTGRFGPSTQKAVQAFQLKFGLANKGERAFGFVGPKTSAKLNELLGQ